GVPLRPLDAEPVEALGDRLGEVDGRLDVDFPLGVEACGRGRERHVGGGDAARERDAQGGEGGGPQGHGVVWSLSGCGWPVTVLRKPSRGAQRDALRGSMTRLYDPLLPCFCFCGSLGWLTGPAGCCSASRSTMISPMSSGLTPLPMSFST